MTRTKPEQKISVWCFRREVTLGTVLHLIVIVAMVIVGWSNLQKDLALIRRDLNELIISHAQLHEHVSSLTDLCREYEFRLRTLEDTRHQDAAPSRALAIDPTNSSTHKEVMPCT